MELGEELRQALGGEVVLRGHWTPTANVIKETGQKNWVCHVCGRKTDKKLRLSGGMRKCKKMYGEKG